MSVLIPRAELDFMLHDWLKLGDLLERPAFADHSRETVDAVLELSEKLATDFFLPNYREGDVLEPRLDETGVRILPAISEALHKYAELGLFSAGFEPGLGGMGLPYLVCLASFAQFTAANMATAGYIMLTVANARLIATFGSQAQIDSFALPQIEGRWLGTMCLSEPQAGSGLADVATRAQPDGEDDLGARYRLTGNKMWISGGDQDSSENIVHLVLAKVPGPDGRLIEGTKGISLFIVPKILPDGSRNDVVVAGLNHKMGQRGTSNCVLNLGENDGAIGWIVGNEGQGLRQMFQMMNEARIGVGLGAATLGYRGYRHAVDYARERLQGRPKDVVGGKPVPIIQHADVRHMLLAQKAYAEGALALCFYCARLVDQHDEPEATALLGLLTPVAKTWPSEYGLAANDLAIQVHGGYGYTREFPVEQLYRDNRLNPIHEGTTGIQAIDLLGRKILRDDGSAIAALRARVARSTAAAANVAELAGYADALDRAVKRIDAVIGAVRAGPADRVFDNATAFLRGFGHVVVAWLWLDMALSAISTPGDTPLAAGKLHACRYFFECELPKVEAWLGLTESCSDVASNAPEEIF